MSYITFSKHGSVWNPIKRLYLTLKMVLLLLQAEEPFSDTVKTIYLKSTYLVDRWAEASRPHSSIAHSDDRCMCL